MNLWPNTTVSKAQTMREVVLQALDRSGKNVEQLAAEIGAVRVNALDLMLQGSMKFHYGLVEPIADALGLDSVQLLRVLLAEQSPDLLGLVDRMIMQGKWAASNEVQPGGKLG